MESGLFKEALTRRGATSVAGVIGLATSVGTSLALEAQRDYPPGQTPRWDFDRVLDAMSATLWGWAIGLVVLALYMLTYLPLSQRNAARRELAELRGARHEPEIEWADPVLDFIFDRSVKPPKPIGHRVVLQFKNQGPKAAFEAQGEWIDTATGEPGHYPVPQWDMRWNGDRDAPVQIARNAPGTLDVAGLYPQADAKHWIVRPLRRGTGDELVPHESHKNPLTDRACFRIRLTGNEDAPAEIFVAFQPPSDPGDVVPRPVLYQTLPGTPWNMNSLYSSGSPSSS